MQNTQPVALITGASRGIGQAIALNLAEQGYNLALLARSEHDLLATAETCQAKGAQVLPLIIDITDRGALANGIDTIIQHFTHLDNVICNHGIAYQQAHHLVDDSAAEWEHILQVNLNASIALTQLVLPHLINNTHNPRALIYIASMAAKLASKGHATYCASKHALLGFANSVFDEVREHSIKVSSICPGFVKTQLVEKFPNLNHDKMIRVDDIAKTVNYILSVSANCCPTEINLMPQCSPFIS